MRRLAALLVPGLLAASASAQDLARADTPGFCVTVDRQAWVRVRYRGIPVVSGSNFSIAKPGWTGNVFPDPKGLGSSPYRASTSRRGDTRILTLTGEIEGAVRNTITIEVGQARLRIENAYSIEASPDVGYVYTECFLSKPLLDGAGYSDDTGGTGRLSVTEALGVMSENVRSVRVDTRFGALTLEMAQEHSVAGETDKTPWQWRSVCDRPWGPEDRKTFSVCNVAAITRSAPIVGRSELAIRFEPSAAFEQEMAKRRAAQEAVRRELVGTRQARLEARAARLTKRRGVMVSPMPQRLTVLDGDFAIGPGTMIVLDDTPTEEGKRAGLALARELREYYGLDLPVVPGSGAVSGAGRIMVGQPGVNAALRALLAGAGEQVTTGEPRPEGYVLHVTPRAVAVAGSDARGAWFGVQTLLQLLRWEGNRLLIPCVHIRDWPEFATRAMMLTLGSRSQMDFLRHTLRRVLPRMKLNMVFVGGASIGKVKWPSHPEAGYETAFLPEDIRELADIARESFLEPVPHVQGFGHTGPLKNSHPELLIPGTSRQPAFDIRKPEAREFVFDIYADAIEAFGAERYFHVGFDEAQDLNLICGEQDAAELVARHITEVSRWLEQRGLRMIMWADMLLDHERFGASSAANSRAPNYGNVDTAPALGRIPKSVMLANWYYRDAEDHPQLQHLKNAGFHVFPTTWWQPANNHNFLRSAHRLGLTWASGSSWMYCSATNPAMMSSLLGEYAWTPNRPPLDELDYEPLGLLAGWMKPPRVSDSPCRQTPVDLGQAMNRSYVDEAPGDDVGWLDLGPEKDLSALEPGARPRGRYLFDIQPADAGSGCVLVAGPGAELNGVPEAATAAVDQLCEALVFLHTAHYSGYGPRTLGRYVVVYTDGEEVEVTLRHTINIGPWLRSGQWGWWRRERTRGHYWQTERAWVGYTLGGEEVDLVAHEWKNPRPDTKIQALRLEVTDGSPDLAVALFALTALRVQ